MNSRYLPLCLAAIILSHGIALADCACGPTYCLDTPAFKAALAQKKKELSRDYPARLVAILDNASRCEACITRGPDGFTLLFEGNDGSLQTQKWDEDNERIGAKNVADGKLRVCRVVWLREAFACCNQKKAEDRPDWDPSLKLSRDMSVPCSTNSPSATQCHGVPAKASRTHPS